MSGKSNSNTSASSDKDTDKELKLLVNFISNSSSGEAIFPVIMGRKHTIPGAIPLLDILRAHISKIDSWKFPTLAVANSWAQNRGMAPDAFTSVDIREVVIGLTPNSEVEEIRVWAEDRFTDSENLSPVGVLPCITKFLPVTLHDIMRLGRMSLMGKTIPLQLDDDPPSLAEQDNFSDPQGNLIPNRWIKAPVKLIIGDGHSWALIISLDISKLNGRFRATMAPFQSALLELLHQLPPLTGPDIKLAVTQFENVFSQISGFRIRLPTFIELPALATLAGWAMGATSFDMISMLTIGTPIFSLIPATSRRWAPRLTELPGSLRILLLTELKVTFLAYNTLLLALRLEVLPEPEIWCFLTDSQQKSVLTWWADWISLVLRGVTVHHPAATAATTRAQLTDSLRAVDPDGQILPRPPYRVRLMQMMISNSISVTRGGCRFLHIERERAIHNFAVARSQPVAGRSHMFSSPVDDAKIMYARYDQYDITSLDGKIPVPGDSHHLSLAHHPRLPFRKVELDLSRISVDFILDVFRKLKRSLTEGIIEWARQNPDKIDELFTVLAGSDILAKKLRAVYDPIRLTGLRVLNIHPIEVPFCEANLTKHQNLAISTQEKYIADNDAKIAELLRERDVALQRLFRIKAEVDKGKSVDRSKWRGPPQPPPRRQSQDQGENNVVQDRVGHRPANDIELHRRGIPPEERMRLHRFFIPDRFPERGAAVENEFNSWRDADEDPKDGRVAVERSKKRKADEPAASPQKVPAKGDQPGVPVSDV